ncbi:MAG: 7-cyano-7-deazaguanine synthase QueC, partial [Deltaproteobacteria bacterium]|nr:7-cyano-7-deazaguanine synthase QueC [Deltaproteobacteria bacterium]
MAPSPGAPSLPPPSPSGPRERAVVLLSGGLDSATALAMTLAGGLEPWALTFEYGQRALREVDAARRVCAHLGVARHRVVPLPLGALVESALMGHVPVPLDGSGDRPHGVPPTYVPARNTVFLALALGYAETIGAHRVVIGANALDYSGYPDCRPEYIAAFNALAAVATVEGASGGRPVRVEAPLMHMTKAGILREALRLGLDPGLTLSCYAPDPEGRPCGRCDACRIREGAFAEAGARDT